MEKITLFYKKNLIKYSNCKFEQTLRMIKFDSIRDFDDAM